MNKEMEGMGNNKNNKKHSRQIKQLRFPNKFIDCFLKSSSNEDEGNII